MERIKLKLSEILLLKTEIYGLQNQGTGESLTKGLLKQELPYLVKYWLYNLGDKVIMEENIINRLRDELVLKYGEIDTNGNTTIPISIESVEVLQNGTEKKSYKVNPNFVEFQKEYNIILNEEKEIEYKPFKLDDLKK
jgi:hypothetical protein